MNRFIKLCLYLAFWSSVVLANDLIEAVKKEDLVKVKELLNQGLDVNEKDTNGDTSIIIAAKKRNPELIKLLFDCGAKANNNLSYLPWNVEMNDRHYLMCGKKEKCELSKNPEAFRSMNLFRLESYLLNNKKPMVYYSAITNSDAPSMGNLSQEDLFWFFDRAIKQNKEKLLCGLYFDLVKIYKKINLSNNSIVLFESLSEIKEIINNLVTIGKKNKYKDADMPPNILYAYEKLINDIANKLDLKKNNDLNYKSISTEIKSKILYIIDFKDDLSNYKFEEAIKKGFYDKVKRFIHEGARIFRLKDCECLAIAHKCPLLLALQNDFIDIVKLLLIFGADPDDKYYEECYDYGEPCWINEFKVSDWTKNEKTINLLKSASLIRKNKIEEGIKLLINNGLEYYAVSMILLAAKKYGLSYLKQIDYIQNNYQKELELLDGYLGDSKENLKELINNYIHDEIEFKDKIREMAYLAAILSGPRYNKNREKKTRLLSLDFNVGAKIASYIS